MPGMLRKSTAFVPRYQWFESISLQQRVMQTFGSSRDDANKLHIAREPIGENGGRQTRGLRRLRIFGRQDKLRADRSKGRETWASRGSSISERGNQRPIPQIAHCERRYTVEQRR